MTERVEVLTSNPVAEKYLRYREVQRALNRRLTKMVPKVAFKECAQKLGLWERGTILFDGEDDIGMLMDYAIYDYRIRGRTNAVERLVKQALWPPGADERAVLDAMLRARFTVLRVLASVPEVGVQVQDLLYEREFLLADVNLSRTAPDNLHIVARVLEFPDFQMTTGAALPFDRTLAFVVIEGVRRMFPEGISVMLRKFTAADHARFTAKIISLVMGDPGDETEQ